MTTDGAVTEPITFSGITPGRVAWLPVPTTRSGTRGVPGPPAAGGAQHRRRTATTAATTTAAATAATARPAGGAARHDPPAAPRAVRSAADHREDHLHPERALYVRVHRIAPGRRSRAGAWWPHHARRGPRADACGMCASAAFRTPRAAGTVRVRVGRASARGASAPCRYRIGLRRAAPRADVAVAHRHRAPGGLRMRGRRSASAYADVARPADAGLPARRTGEVHAHDAGAREPHPHGAAAVGRQRRRRPDLQRFPRRTWAAQVPTGAPFRAGVRAVTVARNATRAPRFTVRGAPISAVTVRRPFVA